jgi:hypothetical protein
MTCPFGSQIASWFGKGGSTSVPLTGDSTGQLAPTPKSSKPETKEGGHNHFLHDRKYI